MPAQARSLANAAGSGRRHLHNAWSSARLVDAEDYVDAVYMVLAAAARTQAGAARNATQAGQLEKGLALRDPCLRRLEV